MRSLIGWVLLLFRPKLVGYGLCWLIPCLLIGVAKKRRWHKTHIVQVLIKVTKTADLSQTSKIAEHYNLLQYIALLIDNWTEELQAGYDWLSLAGCVVIRTAAPPPPLHVQLLQVGGWKVGTNNKYLWGYLAILLKSIGEYCWKISARADGGPCSPSAHAWQFARPPINIYGIKVRDSEREKKEEEEEKNNAKYYGHLCFCRLAWLFIRTIPLSGCLVYIGICSLLLLNFLAAMKSWGSQKRQHCVHPG
jgi:hypothetical protein